MEEKKPRIKILVACHKADPNIRQDEVYMPIQVGKALHPELDLGFQTDNTGDNISEKNSTYCELTALYWAWKNLKDLDYIGLCHYRRYFAFDKHAFLSRDIILKPSIKDLNFRLVEKNLVHDKHDVLLAKRIIYPYCLETEYCVAHIKNDYELLENVIKEKYPDFCNSFNYIFCHNNKLSAYNMFIMKWDEFDRYCNWLFDILFEVERRIKISAYPDQARVFGYMGERLLNVYVHYRNLHIHYSPVVKISDDLPTSYFKSIICNFRNTFTAWLLYPRSN